MGELYILHMSLDKIPPHQRILLLPLLLKQHLFILDPLFLYPALFITCHHPTTYHRFICVLSIGFFPPLEHSRDYCFSSITPFPNRRRVFEFICVYDLSESRQISHYMTRQWPCNKILAREISLKVMWKTSEVCSLKEVGMPFLSPFLSPVAENMDTMLSDLGPCE